MSNDWTCQAVMKRSSQSHSSIRTSPFGCGMMAVVVYSRKGIPMKSLLLKQSELKLAQLAAASGGLLPKVQVAPGEPEPFPNYPTTQFCTTWGNSVATDSVSDV